MSNEQSADDSITLIQEPKIKLRFKEYDGRTYYGKKGKPIEIDSWILSFTLRFEYYITGSANSETSGQVCSLRLRENPDDRREVFIRNTSWGNLKDFSTDLKLVPTFTNLSSGILQKYGEWKREQFIRTCKTEGRPESKSAIRCLGFQNSSMGAENAWCAGPDFILQLSAAGWVNASRESRTFEWTPRTSETVDRTFEVYTGGKTCRLLAVLRNNLPSESFMAFLLMSGHTWLSTLYKVLIKPLEAIPCLVAYGPTATRKSKLAVCATSWFGSNLGEICSLGKVSEFGFGANAKSYALPVIIHDIDDTKLMAALISSSYECLPVVTASTSRKGFRPSSSILFTMNNDTLKSFHNRCRKDRNMRPLSRAVFICMDKVSGDFEERVEADLKKQLRRASRYICSLLQMDDSSLIDLNRQVTARIRDIRSILDRNGVTESRDRIARSWAVLWTATEMFLSRVGGNPTDEQQLKFFVENQLVQSSWLYQFEFEATCSQTMENTALLMERLTGLLKFLRPVVASWDHIVRGLSTNRPGLEEALALNVEQMRTECKQASASLDYEKLFNDLYNIDGIVRGHRTRFGGGGGSNVRALLIPKSLAPIELLELVGADPDPATSMSRSMLGSAGSRGTLLSLPLSSSTPLKVGKEQDAPRLRSKNYEFDAADPSMVHEDSPVGSVHNSFSIPRDVQRLSQPVSICEERFDVTQPHNNERNKRERENGQLATERKSPSDVTDVSVEIRRSAFANKLPISGVMHESVHEQAVVNPGTTKQRRNCDRLRVEMNSQDNPKATLAKLRKRFKSDPNNMVKTVQWKCEDCHNDLDLSELLFSWLTCSQCSKAYHERCIVGPAKLLSSRNKARAKQWKCSNCTINS